MDEAPDSKDTIPSPDARKSNNGKNNLYKNAKEAHYVF
jgi:hypothetical protein